MKTVSGPSCTLVVPAYNEEKRIYRFLEEIVSFAGPVIFVCDGDDNTPAVIFEFAAVHPEVSFKVLSFERRLGKGGGIIEGIKACKTEYAGFTDADGSTPLSEIIKLFAYLEDYDCAIGSRWLLGSDVGKKQKFFRRLESRLFNISVRVLFGMPFSDTQCGAKVFRKKSFDKILPQITSRGFEFDVEALYLLIKEGFSVKEVPIVWSDREESHVGSSDGVNMFLNLLRIRFRKNK